MEGTVEHRDNQRMSQLPSAITNESLRGRQLAFFPFVISKLPEPRLIESMVWFCFYILYQISEDCDFSGELENNSAKSSIYYFKFTVSASLLPSETWKVLCNQTYYEGPGISDFISVDEHLLGTSFVLGLEVPPRGHEKHTRLNFVK